jgi:hypothetical protein
VDGDGLTIRQPVLALPVVVRAAFIRWCANAVKRPCPRLVCRFPCRFCRAIRGPRAKAVGSRSKSHKLAEQEPPPGNGCNLRITNVAQLCGTNAEWLGGTASAWASWAGEWIGAGVHQWRSLTMCRSSLLKAAQSELVRIPWPESVSPRKHCIDTEAVKAGALTCTALEEISDNGRHGCIADPLIAKLRLCTGCCLRGLDAAFAILDN